MGQNGTGKSHLLTSLAAAWDRGPLVIYDPKDDPEALIPNATIVRTAREAVRRLPGRVIYRPELAEFRSRHPGDPLNSPPIWARIDVIVDKLIGLARAGGPGSLLVIHELADLGAPWGCGPALAEAIRKGRSLQITLAMATQRPQGTPVMARSEAQHIIAFTLTDAAARDVAAELMTDLEHPEIADLIRLRPLPLDHTWWHRGPDFRTRLHSPLPYQGAATDER